VENCEELLTGVSGSCVRVAKEWLAARFPLPDVPDSIRKLPSSGGAVAPALLDLPRGAAVVPAPLDTRPTGAAPPPFVPRPYTVEPSKPPLPPPQARRARVEPLDADRFLVKFTLSRTARDKLELARDWMRHRNPDGQLEVIVERALDALLEKLEREKFARVKRPRAARSVDGGRHIANDVKREIAARDACQCAFVAADGARCKARAFLEYDHIHPAGKGGGSEPTNVRLLCRSHNALAAEEAFGRAHVERAIARRRGNAATTGEGVRLPHPRLKDDAFRTRCRG
jgi:hypothetical protein